VKHGCIQFRPPGELTGTSEHGLEIEAALTNR
jgi:hypothetical protein